MTEPTGFRPSVVSPGGPDETDAPHPLLALLRPTTREKLEALAEAWDIDVWPAIAVCVSESYDAKLANLREAEGE